MSKPALEFWFDFASTYSFLASQRIASKAAEVGAEIRYRPFMLGVVLRERGWQANPADTFPAKGQYMWRDLARRAELRGHGFTRPSQFPRNPVLANRIAQVAADEGWAADFVPRAFAANFISDQDIADPAVMAGVIEACDQDPERVLPLAQSEANKETLKRNTAEALAKGIFGGPSFVVGEELFWGDDRLEDALAWWRRG